MSTNMKSSRPDLCSLTQFCGSRRDDNADPRKLQLTTRSTPVGGFEQVGWMHLSRDDARAVARDLLAWADDELPADE